MDLKGPRPNQERYVMKFLIGGTSDNWLKSTFRLALLSPAGCQHDRPLLHHLLEFPILLIQTVQLLPGCLIERLDLAKLSKLGLGCNKGSWKQRTRLMMKGVRQYMCQSCCVKLSLLFTQSFCVLPLVVARHFPRLIQLLHQGLHLLV